MSTPVRTAVSIEGWADIIAQRMYAVPDQESRTKYIASVIERIVATENEGARGQVFGAGILFALDLVKNTRAMHLTYRNNYEPVYRANYGPHRGNDSGF